MNYSPTLRGQLPAATAADGKNGKVLPPLRRVAEGFRKMFFNPAQSFTQRLSLSFPLQKAVAATEKDGREDGNPREKRKPSPIKLEIYCHARF